MADLRISMLIELNAQRARAEAAALRAETDRLSGTVKAAGTTAGAAAAGIDQLAVSGGKAKPALDQASSGGEALAAAAAMVRQSVHPLEAALMSTLDALRQVTIMEEIGALTAQEAALAHDKLSRSLFQTQQALERSATGGSANAASMRQSETAMQRMIAAATGVSAATGGSVAAQLQHGAALDDLRARFDPLFAASRRYELELREIAEAERLGAISAQGAAAARDRAAASLAPTATGLRAVGDASRSTTAYVANLGFQFNDIGMMLAAGQNPLMLMMQQGPQVTQVFDEMRRSGQSVGQSIKAALLNMLNPMSLVTMGAIALGGYAVQALIGTSNAADMASNAVTTLADQTQKYVTAANEAIRPTDELKKSFGESAVEARKLLTEIAAFEGWKASKDVIASASSIREKIGVNLFNDDFGNQKDLLNKLGLSTWEQSAWDTVRGIQAAFRNLQDTDLIIDPELRLDAQLTAVKSLRDQWAAASDMDGTRSADEAAIVDLLNQQVLAVMKQRAEREALMRETSRQDWIDKGFSGPLQPLQGKAPSTLDQTRQVSDTIASGNRELEIARAKLVYGERSAQVRNLENQAARAALETEIARQGIGAQSLQATQQRANLEARLALDEQARNDARARTGAQLLADLQNEARLVELTAKYGADSLEVAYARAGAEREAQAALLAAQGIVGEEARALMEAWDAARGIASVNMAAGIGAAADQAQFLAADLGISLQKAIGIMGLANKARAAAVVTPRFSFGGGSAADGIGGGATLGFGDLTSYPNRTAPVVASGAGSGATAGSGRGGTGGGAGSQTNSVLALIQAEERELAILRELDPVKQELLRKGDELTKATPKQRQELEALIRTRMSEKTALDAVLRAQEEVRSSARSAFVGWVSGANSFRDALGQVLGKLAEMAASSAFDMIWPTAATGGGGGGFLSGILNLFGIGGARKFADGGMITGPGGPREDNHTVRVSSGEYIVNAAATAGALPLLDAINAGVPVGQLISVIAGQRPMAAFADGGLVGSAAVGVAGVRSWTADLGGAAAATAGTAPAGKFEQHIHLYGATGNAEIQQMVADGVRAGLELHDREVLPVRVADIVRNPAVRGR